MSAPAGADPVLAAVGASAQMAIGGSGSSAVKLFLILTALSFGTSLIVSLTSFTRIIIVFSFLRQALGSPSLPPNQVLMGLSLFLTFFIMAPTFSKLQTEAFEPLMEDKISIKEAMVRAEGPVHDWLIRQTDEKDLRLFFEISGRDAVARGERIPLSVLAPAYMISELSTAFRMGLYVFLPMLLVDLLVASVLMALGMQMVPPTMISLALKLAVFLLAGGWNLVVGSLVRSF